MTDTIQPLLDRIRTEGLQEAGEERERILTQAREEAADILRQATAEAGALKDAAEKDVAQSRQRGTTALEQAARDTLLRLRSELNRQLQQAASTAASASLSSAEGITSLLREMLGKEAGRSAQVEVPAALGDQVKQLLPALLSDLGRTGDGLQLSMNPDREEGFNLRFEGDPAVVEISVQTVAEWMSALLRPELAALLAPPES